MNDNDFNIGDRVVYTEISLPLGSEGKKFVGIVHKIEPAYSGTMWINQNLNLEDGENKRNLKQVPCELCEKILSPEDFETLKKLTSDIKNEANLNDTSKVISSIRKMRTTLDKIEQAFKYE